MSVPTKTKQSSTAAKRVQQPWLQRPVLNAPANEQPPPATFNELIPGMPRLLSKAEVLAIVGVSFPTVYHWMCARKFPIARIVGGQSKWLSVEIEQWLQGLQFRRYRMKGDAGFEQT